MRTMQHWSDQSDLALFHHFSTTEWYVCQLSVRVIMEKCGPQDSNCSRNDHRSNFEYFTRCVCACVCVSVDTFSQRHCVTAAQDAAKKY